MQNHYFFVEHKSMGFSGYLVCLKIRISDSLLIFKAKFVKSLLECLILRISITEHFMATNKSSITLGEMASFVHIVRQRLLKS